MGPIESRQIILNSGIQWWCSEFMREMSTDVCDTEFKSAFGFKRTKDTKEWLRLESVGDLLSFFQI